MVARFTTWRAHTPTWWMTAVGMVLIAIWLVLDFIAVMTEQSDTVAWVLGTGGIELLALGNLIPLSISSHQEDVVGGVESDRSHWRGVAEACFGVVVFGTQVLPRGPLPYALMACAVWICFLSVLAFALRWRWPFRRDGDRTARV